MNSYMDRLEYISDKVRLLEKAPPGPPPRLGLEWKEETHRWIRPREQGGLEEEVIQAERTPSQAAIESIRFYAKLSPDERKREGYHDVRLQSFAKARWGSQNTQVVSGEEFDSLPTKMIYRGISHLDYLEVNLNDQFFGLGVFGNGQYYAGSFNDAASYGSLKGGGWVHRAKLHPDAKVATEQDVKQVVEDRIIRYKDNDDEAVNDFLDERGRLLAYYGYDAYHESSLEITVVFNKSKLMIDERTLPTGEYGVQVRQADLRDRERVARETFLGETDI